MPNEMQRCLVDAVIRAAHDLHMRAREHRRNAIMITRGDETYVVTITRKRQQ